MRNMCLNFEDIVNKWGFLLGMFEGIGGGRRRGRARRGVKERSGSRVSVTAERAGIRQPSLFGMKS